jgi:hypothetical protein
MAKYADCMRSHRVSNFPDANPAGDGVNVVDPTFQGPYITLDVPDQATIQSPAFAHAEGVCQYPVPNAAHGSPAGP